MLLGGQVGQGLAEHSPQFNSTSAHEGLVRLKFIFSPGFSNNQQFGIAGTAPTRKRWKRFMRHFSFLTKKLVANSIRNPVC
jgi:hypothetical protein